MSRVPHPLRAAAVVVAFVAAAQPVAAQSLSDSELRLAPQFHSYSFGSPSGLNISELSIPIYVLLPLSPTFSLDVGSAYASARVTSKDDPSSTSTVSGLTDTQIRGTYTVGSDFMVLTAGVNLPTGQSTVTTQQATAAGLIASDFLAFPIAAMGSGFGATGGVAMARPVGDWDFGFGASARHSAQYDPFDAAGGAALHYQPGNEYRVRLGADRAVGTGRLTLGVTYSTFGNDNLGGSIYNTGDRYITTLGFVNTLGNGDLSITGWDLLRRSGQLADGSTAGQQNIGNLAVAYGIRAGSAVIEPNVETRVWTQASLPSSLLGTLGLRMQLGSGALTFVPSAGYTAGRLAAVDANSVATTASLTGFHATVAIIAR